MALVVEPPTPNDDDDVVEYQFPLQRLSLITEQAVEVAHFAFFF